MRHLAEQNVQRLVNWRARAERLRGLPLPEVLRRLEAVRDPIDPAKWRTPVGVLSVNGSKFMNWTQGAGGGGAIDLVMHLRQAGFGKALNGWKIALAVCLRLRPKPGDARLHPCRCPSLWQATGRRSNATWSKNENFL